jgi:hypothetical protein
MSEDIDLKITVDEDPSRGALRRLREDMTDALVRAGFQFEPGNPEHRKSSNESRYRSTGCPTSRYHGGRGSETRNPDRSYGLAAAPAVR